MCVFISVAVDNGVCVFFISVLLIMVCVFISVAVDNGMCVFL